MVYEPMRHQSSRVQFIPSLEDGQGLRPKYCAGRAILQIYRDIGNRLCTAHQKITFGGFVERLGFVDDCSRNQAALAVMTYTSAARPADGDVARLSQLQNALIGRRVPMRGDATARK